MAVSKWIESCRKKSWTIRIAPKLKKEVSIIHFNALDALRLGLISLLGFLVVFGYFLLQTTQERSMVSILKNSLQLKDQELKTVENQKLQVETLLSRQSDQLEKHLSDLRKEQDEIRGLLGKKKRLSYSEMSEPNSKLAWSLRANEEQAFTRYANSPIAFEATRFGTKSSRGGPSYASVIYRAASLQRQIDLEQNELNRLRNFALIKHQELQQERIALISTFDRIPSLWPTNGEITSGFGYRSLGGGEFHPGVDIATSYGSPIVAAASGHCTLSGFKSGFGLTVLIDHENGLVTQYSHCSQLLVREGELIHKGDRIAAVGMTGYTTGPHVHYQMFYHGAIINPSRYLGLTIDTISSSGGLSHFLSASIP